MKYGESLFDILYLLIAIPGGMALLRKARTGVERLMGWAVLILGCGDAFHLVPRVLRYFVAADFTVALGVGKLVTSLTMTVFYVLMYHIYLGCFAKPERKNVTRIVYALLAVRVLLCLFPQNGWLQNESGVLWAFSAISPSSRSVRWSSLCFTVCAAIRTAFETYGCMSRCRSCSIFRLPSRQGLCRCSVC